MDLIDSPNKPLKSFLLQYFEPITTTLLYPNIKKVTLPVSLLLVVRLGSSIKIPPRWNKPEKVLLILARQYLPYEPKYLSEKPVVTVIHA